MESRALLSSLFLILACFSINTACEELNQRQYHEDCTYVIYVQTGDLRNAGTHAVVSLELRDKYINSLNITNLESWGLTREQWHDDYFRRGNLDVFAIKAKCLKAPVCSITLSHDNSGFAPGWFVDFVDVTSISPWDGCRSLRFPVKAWLAFDKPPFYSTRRAVYLCDDVPYAGSETEKSLYEM